jgi:hypothetical protein
MPKVFDLDLEVRIMAANEQEALEKARAALELLMANGTLDDYLNPTEATEVGS